MMDFEGTESAAELWAEFAGTAMVDWPEDSGPFGQMKTAFYAGAFAFMKWSVAATNRNGPTRENAEILKAMGEELAEHLNVAADIQIATRQ